MEYIENPYKQRSSFTTDKDDYSYMNHLIEFLLHSIDDDDVNKELLLTDFIGFPHDITDNVDPSDIIIEIADERTEEDDGKLSNNSNKSSNLIEYVDLTSHS